MELNSYTVETSITIVDGIMVISLSSEMSDTQIDSLMTKAFSFIEKRSIRKAVLNFKSVHLMDSYTFNQIYQITLMLRLIGTDIIWCNMSPGIVISFLDFNYLLDKKNIVVMKDISDAMTYFGDKYV